MKLDLDKKKIIGFYLNYEQMNVDHNPEQNDLGQCYESNQGER